MDKRQFQNEIDYNMALILAREMLNKGIIDRQDFLKADKFYINKYKPLSHIVTHPKPPFLG